uniref:THAP-type domain-containing protein n=1 Tax=Anopheles braziliensis TaxID=58242 RepID=A0A2M3ZCE4_9DIPT
MRCLFEGCENSESPENKGQDAVRYFPFPVTDYICDRLRRLAKKRLYWWCRICGVDHTRMLHQLAVCSKHFLKGSCASLWDVYDPDWVPSLYIPASGAGTKRSIPSATKINWNDFIGNEKMALERITNQFWETNPDSFTLWNGLINEIIAYPIRRAYAILDGQNDLHRYCSAAYDVTDLPEDLRNSFTRHSSVPGLAPEMYFSNVRAVTIVNLALQPRWETERIIMKLQHSVLELINMMEE